jgi:broad specificity phosphatase PhoE
MPSEALIEPQPARWRPIFLALLIVVILVAPAGSSAVCLAVSQEGATTVYLVRHAEKDRLPGDDPGLTTAGQERALALRHVLEEAGVSALYASQYRRTQETLSPLADLLGLDVEIVAAGDNDGLVRRIRRSQRGKAVVVCGHSNTVPEIIGALGAGPVEPIVEADEYDNLYVVRLAANGTAEVTTLKYGRPPQ